jgi:hypothetical protein
MPKAAFNKKKNLLARKLDKFKEVTSKLLYFEHRLYGA